ncbi:quinone oxidoreductase family protein [Aquincola tertiaricarbonis]|uniref:quinone oxidoreductase family protein n=1 Tax=Aquincola tertiaricarbonis TaxID=391953 RepID=UPI0006150E5E|nr:quinone oxidoreductase [Aquincola tertiaricarbonis]
MTPNTTIRFHAYGGPDVLQVEDDAPVGEPGAGQVRLRHSAIGVNFIDTLFRQGAFPVPLPSVPGVEGVGVIEALGPGVPSLRVGQRVAYYLAPGSDTQVRLIDASALVQVPDDLDDARVASVLTKGLTAWAGLHGYHALAAGQTVLMQGASSAVGGLLARWAKALGARVIGTAGSMAKRQALEGAIDHVLASDAPDLGAQVRALVPDGVDVVYELVGRATFEATMAAVKDGGTIVSIGAASGAPVVDAQAMSRRGVRLVGGPMAPHLAGRLPEATAAVFQAWRSGVLGEVPYTRWPLRQAAAAHEALRDRSKQGALVLVP